MSSFILKLGRKKVVQAVLVLALLVGLGFLATNWRSFADTLPASASGTVQAVDGTPIADATVAVSASYTTGGSNLSVKTDASGRYSLSGLKANPVISFSKDGTPFDVAFTDVPSGYWARKEIGAAVNAGIVQGYSATIFNPEQEVTRDQMAVFLARAIAGGEANVPAATTTSFKDVAPSFWAYKHIEFLNKLGVSTGYGDGTYHSDYKVSRDQMAVFISRAVGLGQYENPIPTFTDVPTSFWAYKEIEACVLNGVVSGFSPTEYRPLVNVTRAQMAVFMMRAFTNYPMTRDGYKILRNDYPLKGGESQVFNVFLQKPAQCTGKVALKGSVFADNKTGPMGGVRVEIDPASLPPKTGDVESERTVLTDSAGYFEIGCFDNNSPVTLNFYPVNATNKSLSVTTAASPSVQQYLGVIFANNDQTKAKITITATDSAGAPVTGAAILHIYDWKFPGKLDTSGRTTIEVDPGIYEVTIEKSLVDRIIYYDVSPDSAIVTLTPGENENLTLSGLTVLKEETF